MRFFVFVDTDYYPYVDDPIEAGSIEEAERILFERRVGPSPGESIYLAPESVIRRIDGPTRVEHPNGGVTELFKLQTAINESRELRVQVEPGSIQPEDR